MHEAGERVLAGSDKPANAIGALDEHYLSTCAGKFSRRD
jgi:hypothetical protein